MDHESLQPLDIMLHIVVRGLDAAPGERGAGLEDSANASPANASPANALPANASPDCIACLHRFRTVAYRLVSFPWEIYHGVYSKLRAG